MRGPLTHAQRELLDKVKHYQKVHGPGPTLTIVAREMVNGVALERVLPRLISDGWLCFESLGKSTRLVAKR